MTDASSKPQRAPRWSATSPWFKPSVIALVWLLLLGLLYRAPLLSLANLATHDDNASHIFLIPLISAWLLFLDRKHLSLPRSLGYSDSLILMIPAFLIVYFSLSSQSLTLSGRLTFLILSLVLFLQAGFIAIAGRRTARQSWFAMAFLFLAVPLPDSIANHFIYALQAASAWIAELLFNWSGVPVLRDGFIFHLPRVNIEVAQECSGIRSSIALLILAILIAHFAFRPFWKKALFIAAGLAMMVVKNGVRIVTLTLLANYVDPDFLFGKLHHQGGIVFFLLGLVLLLPIYKLLTRGEARQAAAQPSAIPPAS